MSRIRIVVADRTEAIFYDATSLASRPKEVARIADPEGRLHDQDLVAERPGRAYESVGKARHAIERENDAHYREAVKFARRIARRLDEARLKGEFDSLIVAAEPSFLGMMREEMSGPTRSRVIHEIHKDLVHSPPEALRRHLPAEAAELHSGA